MEIARSCQFTHAENTAPPYPVEQEKITPAQFADFSWWPRRPLGIFRFMNQAEVVRRYLQDPRDVDFRDTGFPCITISREAGTDSHGIGRAIIMRLGQYADPDLNTGWDLYDQKLCALIAQNKSLDADYDTLLTDKYRGGGVRRMVYEMLIGSSQEYRIQKKIDEVIHLLARLGKVVIIGRGGFHIARQLPSAIHLRLVAPWRHRLHNVMKYDNLSAVEAARKIKAIDRERTGFLKSYHRCNLHDPTNFDLIWNVGRGTTADLVNAVAELVHQRLGRLRKAGAIHAP